MNKFPSSKQIIDEAIGELKVTDVNSLHEKTHEIMLKYRQIYYAGKIAKFLERDSLSSLNVRLKGILKKEMLRPIKVGEKTYTNFMEEASRRISQTFQVVSGNIAELCVEQFLLKEGLELNRHFKRKQNRTDFTFYYPSSNRPFKYHRLEVKNVKLRERAIRGLAFDGDSILGFFDDESEFTKSNIDVIDKQCRKTKGYCYLPPKLYSSLGKKVVRKRFKKNTEFANDMVGFVRNGFI